MLIIAAEFGYQTLVPEKNYKAVSKSISFEPAVLARAKVLAEAHHGGNLSRLIHHLITGQGTPMAGSSAYAALGSAARLDLLDHARRGHTFAEVLLGAQAITAGEAADLAAAYKFIMHGASPEIRYPEADAPEMMVAEDAVPNRKPSVSARKRPPAA